MFLVVALWNVIVVDSNGRIVFERSVEDGKQALTLAETYISRGYSVTISSTDGTTPRINSFMEGSRNVVTSVNSGSGIEVNASDPANPVVSLKRSCNSNQILVWNGSDWVCEDKPSPSSGRDYTQVSMLSSPKNAYWDEAFYICDTLTEGGYTDWRVPTIAELVRLCMIYKENGDDRCVGRTMLTTESGVINSSGAALLTLGWYGDSYPHFYVGATTEEVTRTFDFFCVR